MKLTRFAAVAGLALVPLGTTLQSTHKAGETRVTTFTITESTSMVDMQVLMNGEEGGMGEMEMTQEMTGMRAGVFTDSVRRGADGAPAIFTRNYSDLEKTADMFMSNEMMGDEESSQEFESDLEGLTVLFTLDEGDYTASFPEGEAGDEDLLEGLEALLPWGGLLSSGEVSVDDEWEVEPRAFWSSLSLGADLAWEDGEDVEGTLSVDPDTDEAEVDGEITATLTSVEDGLATITLAVEISEFIDMTEAVLAEAEGEDPGDVPEGAMMPDIKGLTTEESTEGEATVVWNIEGGYMVSFDANLETASEQTLQMAFEGGPQSMEIEQISSFEGELEISVEVTVER